MTHGNVHVRPRGMWFSGPVTQNSRCYVWQKTDGARQLANDVPVVKLGSMLAASCCWAATQQQGLVDCPWNNAALKTGPWRKPFFRAHTTSDWGEGSRRHWHIQHAVETTLKFLKSLNISQCPSQSPDLIPFSSNLIKLVQLCQGEWQKLCSSRYAVLVKTLQEYSKM